jgi:hypothetical protein
LLLDMSTTKLHYTTYTDAIVLFLFGLLKTYLSLTIALFYD